MPADQKAIYYVAADSLATAKSSPHIEALKKQGKARDLGAYSLNTMAAPAGKFMRSAQVENSPLNNIAYAYHFDAGLYANYLRAQAETRDVKRIEGKIVSTVLRASDGHVESVILASGTTVQAVDIDPRSSGLGAIGHMGYFRRKAQPLWQETLRWFDEHSAGARA